MEQNILMPHTDYCPINYLIQQIAVDYPLRIAWQIINCFRSICKIKKWNTYLYMAS